MRGLSVIITLCLIIWSESIWPVPVKENEVQIPITLRNTGVDFPIAFSIRASLGVDHIAALIQQIYRPQNLYCIHIDKTATIIYEDALKRAVSCFGDNVFFINKANRIVMNSGKVAMLEADLACAKKLIKRSRKWKYWINLSGNEIPLKTNWEIVTALKLLNGSNAVSAYVRKQKLTRVTPESYLDLNITWYLGDDAIAVRREFTEYLLENDMAALLLDAFRAYEEDFGPYGVSEGYYSILNNNPAIFPIPGAFTGIKNQMEIVAPARAERRLSQNMPCRSRVWRGLRCLHGAADVPFLKSHPHFFVDSFAPSFTVDSRIELQRWHMEKIRHEIRTGSMHPSFNARYYSQLEVTQSHL